MSGSSPTPPQPGGTADPTPPDRTALYRIAYEQSLRALDDQTDEWNGLRGRVGTFMALIASATAFLVGTGIRNSDRDIVFYGLATVGSAAFGAALVATAWALLPTRTWKMRADVETFIETWIEGPDAAPDEAAMLRGAALAQQDARKANDRTLSCLRNLYFTVITSGTVSLGLWILLVWLRAKVGSAS